MRRRKRGSARHSATEPNCVYDQVRKGSFQNQITQGHDPRAQTLRGSMNFHVYFNNIRISHSLGSSKMPYRISKLGLILHTAHQVKNRYNMLRLQF